ncbi:MAG: Zn-ribbon domain-containing OB-fold protein [Ktedonobacteraceae bacterium]
MAETSNYKKPIPIPDEAFKLFFEGAREHKLMIQRCSACGTATWPVKSRCPTCLSGDLAWVQASGKGTLYTFALMHQVFHPGFASEVPYNIAEVDLAEGVRMLSSIVGCSNADLRIGMPLDVTFEDITDEISLPKFKPAENPPKSERNAGLADTRG